MRRNKVIFFFTTALVLSAGLVVGRLSAEYRTPAVSTEHGRGWFSDALGLSPEQRQQMDAIWSDVKQQGGKLGDRRRDLSHDRDVAVHKLLTADQAVAYDKLQADYHASQAEIDKEREKMMQTANDRSRALLTPEQVTRWEAMSKDMRHGPATRRASTRPG